MRTIARRASIAAAVFIALALPITAWVQRYNIYDWWQLHNYSAPPAIAELARQDSMTDYGRRLFYINHPELDDKSNFAGNCPSVEQTIVLGCYINTRGIFLYTVNDKRLNGVEQVTAAHEMLHAAYDRLDPGEKSHVDDLINQAYAKVTDERIKNTVESYRKNNADVVNELHSILGTEVKNLPTDLENYYSRYFSKRAAVVAYSEKYEGEFTSRQKKVGQHDQQLQQLKLEIDGLQTDADIMYKSLTEQRAQLNALYNAHEITAYNSKVDEFNTQVASYNEKVAQIKRLINSYNELVAARNKIALEEQDLAKSIDSRPQTIQSQ